MQSQCEDSSGTAEANLLQEEYYRKLLTEVFVRHHILVTLKTHSLQKVCKCTSMGNTSSPLLKDSRGED